MKKLMMTVGAGLVLSVHSFAAVAGFNGTYTYKLILRDDWGLALNGTDESAVSSNYKIEVFTSDGVKLNAWLEDASFGSGRTIGHNCTVSVPVGDGSGYAKVGERLTLVVTSKYAGEERFRLDRNGVGEPVRVWTKPFPDSPARLPQTSDDFSSAVLGPQWQWNHDPADGALGLPNTPEVSIVEQGGAYKVSFNYSWNHVYSIRTVEGAEAVGKDGEDLTMYESLESLNADTAFGTYFYDSDFTTGTKEFFVKKPTLDGVFLIGLAVDGRLLEYIQVGDEASSVLVTPGFPIEYETEAAAMAAKTKAEVAPSESVATVLMGDGMSDGYKTKFTVEVLQEDGKWFLAAQLTPTAWTNLMESATAATRQIPVADIAQLPMGATTNVVLTGCTPGFYYSLNSGTSVTNIAADAEAENLGVLCGADGVVEFPMVKKPGADAGFFKVVINLR